MTLQEADRVAEQRLPVLHRGIRYERIQEIGYKYLDDGRKIPFIRLKDNNGLSFTDARPHMCELAKDMEGENV